MTDIVVPNQDDRDAAADYFLRACLPDDGMIKAIREGRNDENTIVQTLTRHRLAALDEAERAAENCEYSGLEGGHHKWDNDHLRIASYGAERMREDIETAIRNLKGQP